MNKHKLIKRLAVSGALLAQVAPMVLSSTQAFAIQPSSAIAQSKFDQDMAAYKTAKAQYDRDKAAYDAAKAKYDTDKAAYDKAKVAYDAAMTKYTKDKATYDQKKAEYDRAMAIAEQNKNTPGYLTTAESQALIFKREPNARVSFSGNNVFFDTADGDNGLGVINASAEKHIAAGHVVDQPDWADLRNPGFAGGGTGETGRIQGTAVGLTKGQTMTVRYDGLQNSSYNGREIAAVEYKYSVVSSPSAQESFTMVIYQDPTVTTYFGTSKDVPTRDGQIRNDVTYYYEDGSKVDFSSGEALVSFSSLNYSNQGIGEQEYAKPVSNLIPVQINGSSVTFSDGKIAATSSNHSKEDGSLFDRGEWDSTADNPNSYYAAGVAKLSGTTISFIMGNHALDNTRGTLRQWFQFNSVVRAYAVPERPVEPKLPTAPTAPTAPTPPTAPTMPVGPTAVSKSVSLNNKDYAPAETTAKAVDAGKSDASWYWKVDFKLSNNTNYDSIVLTDTMESVQTVKREDVKVYDATGKDVTAQGTLVIADVAGDASKQTYKWTANQTFLTALNAEYGVGKAKATEQPTMSMKIKATARDADAARLRQYLDTATNTIVLPNTATMTVGGQTGTNAKNTVTEQSNKSHVRFKVENTVSNPEKKVTDLNERNVDRNHLGLVDRNQTYTISFDTGQGTTFSKLNITDIMPNGFKSNGTAVITNSAGKDITSLFDVSISGQTFKASIKPSASESTDLVNTKVSIKLAGTAVRWLGDTIKNTATIEDFTKSIKTNETVTVIPDDGEAIKESTFSRRGEEVVDSYAKAETDETATRVRESGSTYYWRNTFKLPNKTHYTSVVITDTFENVQKVNTAVMQVLDSDGNDVAAKGKFEVTDLNDKQKSIKWTASAEYLAELNAKFGVNSDAHPTLTLKIPTDVKGVSSKAMESYKNQNKHYIIPNTASISLRDNSGITVDYKMDTNVSKVNVPSVVDPGQENPPTKTVTDNNETNVATNRLGFETLSQTYNVKVPTTAGYMIEKLVITDDLDDGFTTSLEQIKLTTANGDDVKALFDITIGEGNVVTATIKESAKEDRRVVDTTIDLSIQGTFPQGYGRTVTNTAKVTDAVSNYQTGTVTTYVPSKPESTKSVSVDGGKSYGELGQLGVRSDEYIWKIDHKLANHSEYSEIVLNDELEGIQAVDASKVKVYNYDGTDITNGGKVAIKETNGKNVVTWTASAETIKSINDKFGVKSDEEPRLTMTIATNIAAATNADEARSYNKDTDRVEIPNVGGMKLTAKNEGSITVRSNTPKVVTPTPGDSSAKKFVAVDGDNPQWSDKLELSNFDNLYQYRTEFKLASNFNYDKGDLVLSDTFENLQSYKEVKITDASGADITSKFDITATPKTDVLSQTVITAIPKNANDFDDKGDTINMVITGVSLTGATGLQQVQYISTANDAGGFHEGVTIPNISGLKQTSAIPNRSRVQESNKTYVNFNLAADLSKKVENEEVKVVNPAEATEATSLTDLAASAQDFLANPGKAPKESLKALSEALTSESTSKQSLLNLLINAVKGK